MLASRILSVAFAILLLATGTAAPEAGSKWELIARAGAYRSYEALRSTLSKGRVEKGIQAAFDAVLATGETSGLVVQRLANLSPANESEAAEDLYGLLMRAEPNPDVLYQYVAETLEALMQRAEKAPDQRGHHYAWGSTYILEAALTGYEATKQERFLKLALDAMLEIASHRDHAQDRIDDKRGRKLRAWGSSRFSKDENYTSAVTHAGRISTPMARFAWIVSRDETLSARYADEAEFLLNVAMEALREYQDEFRISETAEQGFYWRTIADRIEPLNHQASVGEALLFVAALVDDPYWDNKAMQLASFIRNSLHLLDNNTIGWTYSPTLKDPRAGRPEPIWKGQVTIRFFIEAEKQGVAFTREDLEAVTKSIRLNVLRDGKAINSHISPTLVPLEKQKNAYGGYTNLVVYYLLNQYDKDLGNEIVRLIAQMPDLGGWFGHPKTAAAYASRLGAR